MENNPTPQEQQVNTPPQDNQPSATPPPAPAAPMPQNQQATAPTSEPNVQQVGTVPPEWQSYSTGNSVLDSSIAGLLQTMGSNPQEFLEFTQNAIDYGDLNLLDTTAIQSKYPKFQSAIRAMTQAVIAQNQQNMTAVQNTAYSIAGSKENWDSAVKIFNANAPQYLKETVKTMIDNGHVQEGTNMLMSAVQGFGSLPQNMPQYQGNGTSVKGYSFDEMKAELNKLVQQAGGASLESGTFGRRYQEIMHRRNIGRAQGL